VARRLRQLAGLPVSRIDGIGPKRLKGLEEMGITTILDLITHYPRRYLDRTGQVPIRELTIGQEALVLATVRRVEARQTRQRRSMVEIDLADESGVLRCVFFNQPWRAKQLTSGTEVAVFGRVDAFRGLRQMTSPVVDLIGNRTGRVVPLYPQSDKSGLTTWELGQWVDEALRRAGEFAEPLPAKWRDVLSVMGRNDAMRQVHLPDTMPLAQMARHRLAFDELLRLQLVLVMRKRAVERDAIGIRHATSVDDVGALVTRFHASLPFPLTGAQQRAIREIGRDLASPLPMHRLLQGDVGAGKTLVAVTAMLMAVQGGHQAAMMAPTEVLAEQHFAGVRALIDNASLIVDAQEGSLFPDRPVAVRLLTNRTTAAERRDLAVALMEGSVDLLIGTHALITDAVQFRSLGVVVIDEQHRFGVEQRAALRAKGAGSDPDVLVMTATPIPRTAAMTVYGDLDTTILDELPPGRTPIVTKWCRGELEEAQAWGHVREEVAAGRQAYVVCPLVEGSDKIEARSATETYEELDGGHLHGLRLGLLHGQMPSKEKDEVMDGFRRRELDVLVATTVIEVGVDVPNATVMVILDADRFGIAQLHQLRGRVGRGAAKSFCYLLSEGSTPDSISRLEAIEGSTDGFELAEIDLELRGEGTILGTRQKGKTDLKLASLRRDRDLVARAREVAIAIVSEDPTLSDPAHAELDDEIRLFVDPDEAEFLFKS
jgi:ATP-dependent DNA helicase RecG